MYNCTFAACYGCKKNFSNTSEMCKHIWLKVFLNKTTQKCRDAKKFQVSVILNSDNVFTFSRESYIYTLCRRTKVK